MCVSYCLIVFLIIMSIYLKPTLKTVTGHWKNNFSPVGLTCFSDKTWYYIYLLKYKDFTVGKTWLNIQKEYKSWGDCSSCSCPSSTLLSKHGSWHPVSHVGTQTTKCQWKRGMLIQKPLDLEKPRSFSQREPLSTDVRVHHKPLQAILFLP